VAAGADLVVCSTIAVPFSTGFGSSQAASQTVASAASSRLAHAFPRHAPFGGIAGRRVSG
jgi:hypothetical protein